MAGETQAPGPRERFNRLSGLYGYAIGAIILALMAFSIWDEGGIKGDYYSYGIGLAAAIVAIAIGYTTGRKKIK